MKHCTACRHYRKLDAGGQVCTRRGGFEDPVDGEFHFPLCKFERSGYFGALQCGPGAKWFESIDEVGLKGRRKTDEPTPSPCA